MDYTEIRKTTKNGKVTVEEKEIKDVNVPDPNEKMPLDGTEVMLKKFWNDSLDPAQLNELLTEHLIEGKDETDYSVTLRLYEDGTKEITTRKEMTGNVWNGFVITPQVTVKTNEDGTREVTASVWPEKQAAISPGFMVEATEEKNRLYDSRYPRVTYTYRESEDGPEITKTYIVLETGHPYTFTEDATDLHFELEEKEYHPMVVDGVLRTVVFENSSTILEMSGDDEETCLLTATNDLKGGIHINKITTAGDDDHQIASDDIFTFTITLKESEEEGAAPVYTKPEEINVLGSLGYRIYTASAEIPVGAEEIAADGSSYKYNGQVYTRSGSRYSARGIIPESGIVTLKMRASDFIRIVNVPRGTYYTVKETDIPSGYRQTSITNASGKVKSNTESTVNCKNKRESFAVKLLKIPAGDVPEDGKSEKGLNGAEFLLYREITEAEKEEYVNVWITLKDREGKNITVIPVEEAGTIVTKTIGTDPGMAEIGNLRIGTYYLKETKAPDGYNLLKELIRIDVSDTGVTYDDGTALSHSGTGIFYSAMTYTITVANNPGYELPHTGGIGTGAYRITGLALMLGAALILKRKNH